MKIINNSRIDPFWPSPGQLRQAGYNVRDVREIFGSGGIPDEQINQLAETIGAKVLTSDRGRQITGGFFKNAIQVDQRATSVESLKKYLDTALKNLPPPSKTVP